MQITHPESQNGDQVSKLLLPLDLSMFEAEVTDNSLRSCRPRLEFQEWRPLRPPKVLPLLTAWVLEVASLCSSLCGGRSTVRSRRLWPDPNSELPKTFTKVSEMLSNWLMWSAWGPQSSALPLHPPTSLTPCWQVSMSVMAALMYVWTSLSVAGLGWSSMSATKYMELLIWSRESIKTSMHCSSATLPWFSRRWLICRARETDSFTACSDICITISVHCCRSPFCAPGMAWKISLHSWGYLANKPQKPQFQKMGETSQQRDGLASWFSTKGQKMEPHTYWEKTECWVIAIRLTWWSCRAGPRRGCRQSQELGQAHCSRIEERGPVQEPAS